MPQTLHVVIWCIVLMKTGWMIYVWRLNLINVYVWSRSRSLGSICAKQHITAIPSVRLCLWMWQAGFRRSSEVLWEHGCVYMWTWNLNTLKYGSVRMPGRSGETRDRTNKKRGKPGSYSESLYGGWGQGLRPIQPALRHRDKGPITLLQPQPSWTWS